MKKENRKKEWKKPSFIVLSIKETKGGSATNAYEGAYNGQLS